MTSLIPDPLDGLFGPVAGTFPLSDVPVRPPRRAPWRIPSTSAAFDRCGDRLTVVAQRARCLVCARPRHPPPPPSCCCSRSCSPCAAFTASAWQSVVPHFVPKHDLAAAVASNGVASTSAGAIGPALGGVVIGVWTIAGAFWTTRLSNFAVIGACSGGCRHRRKGAGFRRSVCPVPW